jgi:arylformamidase
MPKTEWIDITLPLGEVIPILPAGEYSDSPVLEPRVYRFFDVDKGDKATMSRIEISSHDGTHIDAPLHFIPGGTTIDAMPVETTVGPCRVIEIKDERHITVAELEPYDIKEGERILFKTKNSPGVYAEKEYKGSFVTISLEAARYLAAKRIRLVGMDYLTIADNEPMEMIGDVHKAFLENGIFILEALNLAGVAPGDYDLVCLPLRIEKGDAGPCRVVIKPRKQE